MKKIQNHWWVILAIILVVYHVIVFAVPFPKTAAFFISWVFTVIAILAQVYVMQIAFAQGKEAQSKFYGWPIAKIGIFYLAIQLMVSLAFMALGILIVVPAWIPFVAQTVLLGISAIGFVATDVVRDEVERLGTAQKKDSSYLRNLQVKVFSMVPLAQDSETRKQIETFAEQLRFSDPMSTEELKEIEIDLAVCVEQLNQALMKGDSREILQVQQKASAVLAERNRLCKLNK